MKINADCFWTYSNYKLYLLECYTTERASFTDPESGVTNYTYDMLNRLSTLKDFSNGTSGFAGGAYVAPCAMYAIYWISNIC